MRDNFASPTGKAALFFMISENNLDGKTSVPEIVNEVINDAKHHVLYLESILTSVCNKLIVCFSSPPALA